MTLGRVCLVIPLTAPYNKSKQVLELVGHVLPSGLSDLASAMARACTAFTPSLQTSTNGSNPSKIAGTNPANVNSVSENPSTNEKSDGGQTKVERERGTDLFRAVASVDPGTAHLNAGFRVLEGGAEGGGNGEQGSGAQARRVSGGSSSYCSETRARVVGRRNKRVVFDVCSVEPAMTTFL